MRLAGWFSRDCILVCVRKASVPSLLPWLLFTSATKCEDVFCLGEGGCCEGEVEERGAWTEKQIIGGGRSRGRAGELNERDVGRLD